MEDFAMEMQGFEGMVLHEGEWKDLGMAAFTNPVPFDFGEPFGTKPCIPMYLDELDSLPRQYPSLQELGFYMAGFHWFIDWFVMPFVLAMLAIFPSSKRSMGRLLFKSLQTFCRPPFRSILKTETSNGYNMTLMHDDAYALTGIPVAATIIQYVQGRFVEKKGLYFQSEIVKTESFFQDMELMGVQIEVVDGEKNK
jgi:saccharopine dehydrogenase (NAD+, L-lysine-forming)